MNVSDSHERRIPTKKDLLKLYGSTEVGSCECDAPKKKRLTDRENAMLRLSHLMDQIGQLRRAL